MHGPGAQRGLCSRRHIPCLRDHRPGYGRDFYHSREYAISMKALRLIALLLACTQAWAGVSVTAASFGMHEHNPLASGNGWPITITIGTFRTWDTAVNKVNWAQ